MKQRYNHLFTLAFEVESNNDGANVTEDELLAALANRLINLRRDHAIQEAVGLPDDTEDRDAQEN